MGLRALSAKLIDGDGDAAKANKVEEAEVEEEKKNELDEDVCIICFEPMKSPMCLTCGHEYCKQCIEDWQAQADNEEMDSGRECPICRSLIEQSQMWVKMGSQDFCQSQYMSELLQFPFEYCSKFKTWTDADAGH